MFLVYRQCVHYYLGIHSCGALLKVFYIRTSLLLKVFYTKTLGFMNPGRKTLHNVFRLFFTKFVLQF